MPTYLAKAGNTVTLNFKTSFPIIGDPTVTFKSGDQVVVNNNNINYTNSSDDDITWTASYEVDSGDADGVVTFTISGTDYKGKLRTFTIPTENAPSSGVTIDTTSPSNFSISSVSSTGGTNAVIKAGYYNGTNTGIGITIPIANDDSLINGTVEVFTKTGNANFSSLQTETITSKNSDLTISVADSNLTNAVGWVDGNTMVFQAIINDHAGNPTTSTSNNPSLQLIIDTTPPTTTGNTVLTSSNSNTNYAKVNDILSFVVEFTEYVKWTTASDATLLFKIGNTEKTAVADSDSTTNNKVTFEYTVYSGDTGVVSLPSSPVITMSGGDSIEDAAGNTMTNLALQSLSGSVTVDTTAPTVSYVTSSTANGSYMNGETISIQVVFSETVVVDTTNGTPQLTLETGSNDAIVNYNGTLSTTTATNDTMNFTYTVSGADNHTSSDLDYVGTGSLTLNSGIIKDVAGNTAVLTLAAPGAAGSLGANKAIVVDTTAPTVSNVTSTKADGSYMNGETISIQVVFSETVVVTGTPQLTLETGANDAVVDYVSLSTTTTTNDTMNFTYTVSGADNHTSNDLDYTETDSLKLNGGTIKDVAGNNAVLTLVSPGEAGSLGANKAIIIDTTAPTVSYVTSSTANGSYKDGVDIEIQVVFSETVVVTGTPQLTLETGSNDAIVNYNGTLSTTTVNDDTMNFTYTVSGVANHTSSDLDYVGTGSLTLNSGTIKDVAGNNAVLTLVSPGAAGSLGANKAIIIDTTKPTMTITAATVSGTNISSGSVTKDTSIVLTFTSTENTTDFISGDIDISDGSLDATFSGSEKVYTATLTTITDATYTIDVAANKFTDAAGNGNTAAQQFTWTRDTTAPVVTVNTGTDTVELGGTWTDAGATATDASGAVTVVTTGTVDTSTVGDYIITYTSTDGSGNIGTATRTVNVEDTTAPAPFNVGVVTAEGGTVKENYWNSTNENINVTVPIASDNTLVDGKVQLKVNIGNNNYNLGNEVTILQGYLGTNIVLQQTAAVLENIEGFVEGVNLTFTADITDVNNNGPTTGTNSANVLTVDQTAPTVISFTMSDGAGAVVTSLKIGDTPTVTLQFSEKAIFNSDNDITFTVEHGTLPTMTTTDEGKTWTGTFTPEADIESIGNELKLLSTWTDLAGNPGPTATINYNIDTKPPTIAIKVWDNSDTEVVDNVGTSATSFTIKFVPSETILNFDQRDDIEIEGTLSNPTSNYTFTTTSNYWYEYDSTLILTNGLSTGTIIIKIPAGKVTDQIGNSNEETTFTINYVP